MFTTTNRQQVLNHPFTEPTHYKKYLYFSVKGCQFSSTYLQLENTRKKPKIRTSTRTPSLFAIPTYFKTLSLYKCRPDVCITEKNLTFHLSRYSFTHFQQPKLHPEILPLPQMSWIFPNSGNPESSQFSTTNSIKLGIFCKV